MNISRLQADAIYWALTTHGGNLLDLSVRRASHRTKMGLVRGGLAEYRDGGIYVTEAGYNAAISHYGHSMRNAEMTQNWRRLEAR